MNVAYIDNCTRGIVSIRLTLAPAVPGRGPGAGLVLLAFIVFPASANNVASLPIGDLRGASEADFKAGYE